MLKIGLSLVCFVFLVSCSSEDKTVYDGGVKLQKVSFASLNEWNKDNLGDGFDKAIKEHKPKHNRFNLYTAFGGLYSVSHVTKFLFNNFIAGLPLWLSW